MAVEVSNEGPVQTITLDRPEQLNAFTRELHGELARALKQARDPKLRAVIITGAGRGFCVGQDLNEAMAERGRAEEHLRTLYNPSILAIRALEKPVIAAVNGACAGAGLSLAAACDIRIASERAMFVPAFANIGLIPDAGGSFFLTEILGYPRAFEWMASGRHLSASEAQELGLVSEVVGPGALLDRAYEQALALAEMPGRGVGLTKRLMLHARAATLEEQLELEAQVQGFASSTSEYEAAVNAFLDKRKAAK